jgi:IclR family transcriptional regulator, KDG regulon repressor
MPESGGVLVLHKTLDILEFIREKPNGVKLRDLALSMDMPKATVHRILATLASRGFLDRAEDGGYRMARRLFETAPASPPDTIPNHVALPRMHDLAQSSREAVSLGILDGGEVVVTATVESFSSVRVLSKPGHRRALHCTSIGKAVLAALPEKQIHRLLRVRGFSLPMDELEMIRKQGYAVDYRQSDSELRCIAAPILDPPSGRVLGALSISAPVYRMDLNRARSLAPQLKQTCAAISAAARA